MWRRAMFVISALVVFVGAGLYPHTAYADKDEVDPLAPLAATTVQLPTFGVAVDADGVLALKSFPDPGGVWRAQVVAMARRRLPPNLQARSKLRKVSLVRLEQAIVRKLEAGQTIDEEMQNLAGLQRLRYIFCYPEHGDIVVAGPAEGYFEDASGRTVGITTGRPVLQLEDLAIALRIYAPGTNHRPFVGVSIGPSQEGLARFREFQQTIPRSVSDHARAQIAGQVVTGSRRSLGMSGVAIYTLPANSRFALTLLEADYHMKIIGMGLAPEPVPMATYIELIKRPTHGILQRWWLTPYYDVLRVTADKTAVELLGQGVQLKTEDQIIDLTGTLTSSKRQPSRASSLYATAFTRKYPEIAARVAAFAQTRNLIDLLIAAAFLRKYGFYDLAHWEATTLLDETAVAMDTVETPKQVAAAANAVWRGRRLIAPVGGVSIQADRALDEDAWEADKKGALAAQRESSTAPDPNVWWWD
jgi:hypothetical protein